MSLDPRIMTRAQERYRQDVQRRQEELQRRQEEICRAVPRIAQIQQALRSTAAQAASKGSQGRRSKMLMSRAAPERTRQATSFFTPPHSNNDSSAFIQHLLYPYGYPHYTHRGIPCQGCRKKRLPSGSR